MISFAVITDLTIRRNARQLKAKGNLLFLFYVVDIDFESTQQFRILKCNVDEMI